MIDTFVLKYVLDRQQRGRIYEAVNRFVRACGSTEFLHPDRNTKGARRNRYITSAFNPMGILELAVKDCMYPGNYGSRVSIKCKPALVLHADDMYALSSCIDYDAAVVMVNDFIMELNVYMEDAPLPLLGGWEVSRIDYAFQFRTEEYRLYLMFLRKGCSFREDKYDDSVYIKNSKCTVNFYDKTRQLGLEEVSHMLRFEVQCHRDYLFKMLNDERIGSLRLYELWDEKLALSIVTKRIGKLTGYGNFYSLEKAGAVLLKACRISGDEREALLQLMGVSLHPAVRRESQWDLFAVQIENEDRDGSLRKRLERVLDRLEMNQMAIPVRRRVAFLKNPARIIMELFGNV